ncbi:MAG: hypothetical protein F2659_05880 [Actinobacteria bacterium]|uniref:Unannotated protein n=1 Tax=freshwater metagenome TaxID=449393 RepID=A0A6J6PLY5_9ZZZZ|nr:hypothetical protein [Actinomycetota bacterium]
MVDTEDDPDRPGEQRIAFSSVEGFLPPPAIELAGAGDGAPPAGGTE